jgi:hypothetical protein
MLPTELSYLAQERCKELRGEIREPIVTFFDVSPRRALANFFYSLGDRLMSKPKVRQITRGSKLTEL